MTEKEITKEAGDLIPRLLDYLNDAVDEVGELMRHVSAQISGLLVLGHDEDASRWEELYEELSVVRDLIDNFEGTLYGERRQLEDIVTNIDIWG